MSSILGGHFQGRPTKTHVKHMIHAQCMWSLHIDPGDKAPFGAIPGHKHAGRLYYPKDQDRRWIIEGAAGADKWFAWAYPLMLLSPWIHAWQGPNEFNPKTPQQAQWLADFERRRIELMHAARLKVISYVFGTGNPEPELWRILGWGIVDTDFLGLHQYSMTTDMIPERGHTLRHRTHAEALNLYGYQVPLMLVLEGGIDFKGREDVDGWRARGVSSPQYVEGLARIAQEMQRDPYVLCWLIFGYAPLGWWSFTIDDETSWRLAQLMAAQNVGGTSPAIPEPASVEARILADALPTAWPWNKDHAFPRYVAGRGWRMRGREYDVTIDGVEYRYQVFATGDGKLRVVYAVVDDWGNVKHVEAGT